jgi:hypothetical protein
MKPPSGFLISRVSVPNDRTRPDPLPAATAMYCLPAAPNLGLACPNCIFAQTGGCKRAAPGQVRQSTLVDCIK